MKALENDVYDVAALAEADELEVTVAIGNLTGAVDGDHRPRQWLMKDRVDDVTVDGPRTCGLRGRARTDQKTTKSNPDRSGEGAPQAPNDRSQAKTPYLDADGVQPPMRRCPIQQGELDSGGR